MPKRTNRWRVALGLIALSALLGGCMPAGAVSNPGWTVVTAQDDVVYAAMAMGQVVALDDTEGGAVLWQYPQSQSGGGGVGCSFARPPDATSDRPLDAVYGIPLLAGPLVLVTSYDGLLRAFDRESGALEWQFPAEQAIIGGVSVRDGVAYFGSSDHGVYALDLATQEPVWEAPFRTENWVWGSPAVDQDRVFVGSMDHHVYAIDRHTGAQVWKTDIGGSVVGSVTLADGAIYAGGVDKRLHALDASDGSERWSTEPFAGWLWGEALVHGGAVHFGSLDGQVHALDVQDGSVLWGPVGVEGAVRAGPALFGEELVYGTDTGRLYTVDAATGDSTLRFTAEGSILSTPAVAGQTVYVATAAGRVYALDLSRRGDPQLWEYPPNEK